jgi:hypothetical protein
LKYDVRKWEGAYQDHPLIELMLGAGGAPQSRLRVTMGYWRVQIA